LEYASADSRQITVFESITANLTENYSYKDRYFGEDWLKVA
jgi:hypothetical protein